MTHRAADSSLWETAWRTQPVGGPAILGGDYDPDVLEAAYRHGYFPMVQDRSWQRGFRHGVPRPRVPVLPGSVNPYELTWWAPSMRPVIVRSTVRAGRRLRQTLRRSGWTSTMNHDFAGVLRRCGPERGDVRADRLPRAVSLHQHIGVLVPARHGPTFVTTAKRRSAGHDRRVAIDANLDVVTPSALEVNLIRLESRKALRFAPYDTERIRQDVFVSHKLVESRKVFALKSVAPVRLHTPDCIFIGTRCRI